MKSLFIDCNRQLAPVFAHVHRADDPPIAVNGTPFTSADLPGLLAGYTICLDDHSYLPAEQIAVDILGAPYANTVLLGAFAKVTGEVSLESVLASVSEKFKNKPQVQEKNLAAVKKGYESV